MAPELVVVQGLRDTRGTLRRWQVDPWPVLRPWVLGAVAVSVGLLLATWGISLVVVADPSPATFPGLTGPAHVHDVFAVLHRNALVLALHAMACVAGFIAGSSLPLEAQSYSGLWRRVHDRAGTLAIGFVVLATTFSLVTQAWALGNGAATLAAQCAIPSWKLLVGLLPHAVPELVALFLPLAAWVHASRRERWDELLAATFVTVAFAVPTLVAAAFVEVFVSPHVILWLR